MLGQTILEQFATEGLLVSYFLIVLLALELAFFFIVQKATRKERSPTWILTFSITMFAFSGVYLMRALKDLVFRDATAIVESLYQADFIILSASALVMGMVMRIFFKNGRKEVRAFSIAIVLLGVASLVLNVVSILRVVDVTVISVGLASGLILPVASFPIYVLWKLARRDEVGYKRVFILILVGVLLNFVGLALNFQQVQSFLIATLSASYPVFKFIVLAVIVGSLAMIAFGFFYIPPVDDFLWANQLVALYVIDKTKRVALFKAIYDQGVVDGFSFSGKQVAPGGASEGAFVSGIGGITEMLSETTVADGKKVEYIDQGPVKLLLSYQGELIFMLLVKQPNAVFMYKLRSFKEEFLLFFGDMITRFPDKPEKFLPAGAIATRIFGSVSTNTGGKRT